MLRGTNAVGNTFRGKNETDFILRCSAFHCDKSIHLTHSTRVGRGKTFTAAGHNGHCIDTHNDAIQLRRPSILLADDVVC